LYEKPRKFAMCNIWPINVVKLFHLPCCYTFFSKEKYIYRSIRDERLIEPRTRHCTTTIWIPLLAGIQAFQYFLRIPVLGNSPQCPGYQKNILFSNCIGSRRILMCQCRFLLVKIVPHVRVYGLERVGCGKGWGQRLVGNGEVDFQHGTRVEVYTHQCTEGHRSK
jgi:hypothetical protein